MTFLITDDWELEVAARNLVDVLDPSSVALNGVCRETNQLNTTLCELWLKLGESTKLSGADWGVILWVREQNNPLVANELMEVDWASGSLGLKVGGNGAQTAEERYVSKS